MASKILTKYKQRIQGFELQPSSGGCFELTLDGKMVYSKLEAGRFPDEDALLKDLEESIG